MRIIKNTGIFLLALFLFQCKPAEKAALIRHYPLDGTANDISANAQHGKLRNVVPVTDRHGSTGGACGFNVGKRSRIEIPFKGLALNEYTIAMWVQLNSLPYSHQMHRVAFSMGGYSGDQLMYYVHHHSDAHHGWGIGSYHTDSQTPSYVSTSTDVKLQEWYHLAFTRNSTTIQMFINGVLVESISTSGKSSFGDGIPVAIIGSRYDGSMGFDGSIDDVRIYKRVLSAKAIENIYQK